MAEENVRSTLEFPSLHPCPSSGAATKSPIQMLLSNLSPINPVTPAVAVGFKPTVAESLPQIHMYVFKTESKKLLSSSGSCSAQSYIYIYIPFYYNHLFVFSVKSTIIIKCKQ